MRKYNTETDLEIKASIIVDPIVILKKAIANCKPLLKLTPVKRGGSYYQVWFFLILNYMSTIMNLLCVVFAYT